MKAKVELEDVDIKCDGLSIFGLVITTKKALKNMKMKVKTINVTELSDKEFEKQVRQFFKNKMLGDKI